MTAYAPDTWYTPIVIDDTNNVLVVTEGATVITITVDAGTYYLHDDDSFHATVKGLLYTIRTLLNDGTTAGLGTVTGASSNTYAWAVQTPTGSTGLTNNGLRLSTGGATAWEFTWTGATTMDAHWFGSILSSPIADDASTSSGGEEMVTFPHATRHRMVTRDIGDGHAVDKRKFHYKDVRRSSDRPSDSVHVIWDEGYTRRIRYEDVQGVEVHQTRASEAEWAGTTDRATGDRKATWYDVWDALSDGDAALVVHNSSDDLQVDTHSYELVKAWEPLTWDSFARQVAPAGDYYNIDLEVWVDPDVSSYNH